MSLAAFIPSFADMLRVALNWRTHVWTAVWMSGLLGFALWQGVQAQASAEHMRVIGLAVAVSAVWSVTFSAMLLSIPARWAGPVALVVSVWAAVFAAATGYHYLVYGDQLGVSSLLAIMDSDPAESSEFLADTLTPGRLAATLGIGLAMLIPGLRVRHLLAQSSPRRLTRGQWTVAVLSVLVWASATGTVYAEVWTVRLNNPLMATWAFASEASRVRGLAADFTPQAPASVGAVLEDEVSRHHVVLIGESVTTSHMSLYGYARETTPEMALDRPQFDRYVVRDACSTRHNTSESLADVFSGGMGLHEDLPRLPSLISMLREAGYRVIWLSNQAVSGDVDSMSSAWGRQADERVFVSTRGIQEGVSLDERLLPHLESALAAPEPTVVFLHMMGTHQTFIRRYPRTHARWADDAAVPESVPGRHRPGFPQAEFNRYDNAVYYTDSVVGRALDLAARAGVGSITYFSDHGMNLGEHGEHVYHSMPDGPRQGFEVPVVFWVAVDRPGPASSALGVPYRLDFLRDTVLDLAGVTFPDKDPSRSLFDPDFQAAGRRCDAMAY